MKKLLKKKLVITRWHFMIWLAVLVAVLGLSESFFRLLALMFLGIILAILDETV